MKITSIKQQAKRADRYSVYIDDKYVCSFGESEIVKLGLRIGQEIGDIELRDLKARAVRDKAYDRALGQLSRRPRSEWELHDYLKRKGCEPGVIAGTIERLRERGYVNDYDFAKRWVDNRRLLKPTSKRRLAAELTQKHVDGDIIEQVLSEDQADEREVLKELIERKRGRYPDNLKLMQYLMRQGYSYSDIRSVLSED